MNVVNQIFAYCGDFIINLANLLKISYYEVNAIVFCVFYPAILLVLIITYFKMKHELKRLHRQLQ